MMDSLKNEYGTGKNKGKKKLRKIFEKIKKEGKSKKYDCVVGVSGGTDSSYLVYLAKKNYETEASGGVNIKNVRKIASTGVNRISVGQITHSAPAINFKLEI